LKKRNGSHETFNEEKLARGVSRSGIPFMMAKDIAESINKKIKENNNNTILSSQIKKFVIEELKSRNENVITESYSGYSKSTITDLSANHTYNSKASSDHRSNKKDYVE